MIILYNSNIQWRSASQCLYNNHWYLASEVNEELQKLNEYGVASNDGHVSSNVSIASHVKFTPHLHVVNWRNVVKSTLPSMNTDRIDYLMSLAGAFSINPLILITIVMTDKDLAMASTDREFNQQIRYISDNFARKHLDNGEDPTYTTLEATIRKVFEADEYMVNKFLEIYSGLHRKHNVPFTTRTDSLVLRDQDEDLRPSLLWPWREGSCWELGPTHSGICIVNRSMEEWLSYHIN